MTTIKEQDRNLINLRRSKVSELLSKGYTNQAEIARTLNVSESTISRDIDWFSKRAKETFRTYVQEELPEEFEKAITTYDYIIRTASFTADTTQDDKVRLQALHEVRETRTAKMDLISNHDVMSYQVNKDKGKQDQQQQQEQEQEISEQSVEPIGSEQELEGEQRNSQEKERKILMGDLHQTFEQEIPEKRRRRLEKAKATR